MAQTSLTTKGPIIVLWTLVTKFQLIGQGFPFRNSCGGNNFPLLLEFSVCVGGGLTVIFSEGTGMWKLDFTVLIGWDTPIDSCLS